MFCTCAKLYKLSFVVSHKKIVGLGGVFKLNSTSTECKLWNVFMLHTQAHILLMETTASSLTVGYMLHRLYHQSINRVQKLQKLKWSDVFHILTIEHFCQNLKKIFFCNFDGLKENQPATTT